MLITLILALSLFYHPQPTPEAIWQHYEDVVERYNSKVGAVRATIMDMEGSPDACILQYTDQIQETASLWQRDGASIAVYYELYGDEEAVERLKAKEEELWKEADRTFGGLMACLEEAEKGIKVKSDEKKGEENGGKE